MKWKGWIESSRVVRVLIGPLQFPPPFLLIAFALVSLLSVLDSSRFLLSSHRLLLSLSLSISTIMDGRPLYVDVSSADQSQSTVAHPCL